MKIKRDKAHTVLPCSGNLQISEFRQVAFRFKNDMLKFV